MIIRLIVSRAYNFAFIDGANLHITYENLDWQLDYEKLRHYLEKKLDVAVAYYFIGKTEQNKDIYTKLATYGYTIKLKEPSPYISEEEYCPYCKKLIKPAAQKYKSDCDSFVTLQVMLDADIYDKVVLITSDGDFDNLVKRLSEQDKLKLIFAPCRDGCSWLLKSAGKGRIGFIDDHRDELEKT
jgi:uncharacterized LabA/DUF88 family protein